jgi:iron-sulfur cluster assembly accessory protein
MEKTSAPTGERFMITANARGETAPDGALAAQQTIQLTAKAADRIKATLLRDGLAGYGVRVGVTGGGCAGFQYRLTFEERPVPGDVVWQLFGLRIFVDASSKDHFFGVTLDYVTGLHAAGFKFLNPNASRSCGCGSSAS